MALIAKATSSGVSYFVALLGGGWEEVKEPEGQTSPSSPDRDEEETPMEEPPMRAALRRKPCWNHQRWSRDWTARCGGQQPKYKDHRR